ncbi:unnamed protein product, partial [Meganyctiphanes norvegica]
MVVGWLKCDVSMVSLRVVVVWRCVLVVLVTEVGSSTSHTDRDTVKSIGSSWVELDQEEDPVLIEDQVPLQQRLLAYNSGEVSRLAEESHDNNGDSDDEAATVSWSSWPEDPSISNAVDPLSQLGISGGGSGAQHQCDRQQIEDMRQDQEMFVEPGGYPQGDYDYKEENITIG